MSAAEKLKGLDEAIHLDMPLVAVKAGDELVRWCSPSEAEALSAIRNALPEIIAVLKAAENFVPHMDDEGGCHPDRYGVDCPEWLAIPAALSALDEKLGDVT